MGKKRTPSKAKGKVKSSFTFPGLHEDIVDAVSGTMDPWFRDKDSNERCRRKYTTHVMGRFVCVTDDCSSTGWASKKIAILIREYSNDGYGAEVFNQRCKMCNRLGLLFLDENSYIERVAYRIQKWAGVDDLEPPHYSSKKGSPHERRFCEGCKRGYCDRSDDDEDDDDGYRV